MFRAPPHMNAAPPKSPGTILVLRNGRRVAVKDLSMTQAKHMRRGNLKITVTLAGGQKAFVEGKDIKRLEAMPRL